MTEESERVEGYLPYCPRCKSHAIRAIAGKRPFITMQCRTCAQVFQVHKQELQVKG